MYDARVIANEVLEQAWQAGHDLTQIEIQKICYFLHGHHLMDHGQPLISSEFEAWDFGPVQRSLYDSFKKFGREPIPELATAFDPIRREKKDLPSIEHNSVRETIAKYLPVYLDIPAFELVEMTHRPGTPWTETQRHAQTSANIGMRIDNKLIVENFEGLRPA